MTNSVYLGLSILEISKTLIYEFWYDYIKLKYQNNAKLCYMDTDSFIINLRPKTYSYLMDDGNSDKKAKGTKKCLKK